jgi:hypothetical protein
MSAEADIARARKKPIPEEKMRELLTKARKGATSSFTFSKLVQILDTLGWEITPIFGWTPLHYPYQDKEHLVTEWTNQNPNDAMVEAMVNRRVRLDEIAVDSLPDARPQTVGEHVIMDVGPMKTGSYGIRYFDRREWVGTEGVKITNPRGEEVEFLPDHHDWDRGEKSVTDSSSFGSSEAWRGIRGMGIDDDINKALGTEKHVPAAERTRANTGTCGHCWGNYKLEGGRFVLHGYKRPRWGYVVGKCRGVGYESLERSPDGARDQLDQLAIYLAAWKKDLSRLESGKVDEIAGYNNRVVKRGEPSFDRLVEDAVRKAKQTVKQIEAEIDLYEKVLSAWRERPMPRSGELQRGPGFFTK